MVFSLVLKGFLRKNFGISIYCIFITFIAILNAQRGKMIRFHYIDPSFSNKQSIKTNDDDDDDDDDEAMS